MKLKKMELETVCGITSALPVNLQPEIAFAGRSNVGKSSLINGLLNRKSFARTSGQPGKTQTINFYHINDEFYFVDLPGYGYAKVSRDLQVKWGRMIEKYLLGTKKLLCVFLLVDIRHDPSENDKQMYEWIVANGLRPVIIATKLDKISRGQIKKQTDRIRKVLKAKETVALLPFSSETKQGGEEIWGVIETMLMDYSEKSSSTIVE